MPKKYSADVESILSRGFDVEEFGSANWALCRADALVALSELCELGEPVLGGDVWKIVDGHPSLTRDNWYCQRSADESFESFLGRSIEVAKNYIRNYSSGESDGYLFELVVDRIGSIKRD
jgi:hypothetical protein